MKRIYLIVVYIVLIPFSTAFATYTNNEAFSKMLKLKEQGKIPAYVVERGTYKYVQDNSVAYVNGKNVFMRSQPQKDARVITKLSNTDLEYLGEWTHPKNGEKWICVREKESNEIGWIYGKYIKLLKATSTKSTKIQTTPKEDKKYKKDKTCTEDPCGALGGLLLISPILFFLVGLMNIRKKIKQILKKLLISLILYLHITSIIFNGKHLDQMKRFMK